MLQIYNKVNKFQNANNLVLFLSALYILLELYKRLFAGEQYDFNKKTMVNELVYREHISCKL